MREILDMIERVDPNDTDKLDEIDARVWGFLHNVPIKVLKHQFGLSWTKQVLLNSPERKYTRSRDALKAIRPEGWGFNNYYYYKGGVYSRLHSCSAGHWKVNQWENVIFAEALPTEELAELHAIIQAIKWDRDNK